MRKVLIYLHVIYLHVYLHVNLVTCTQFKSHVMKQCSNIEGLFYPHSYFIKPSCSNSILESWWHFIISRTPLHHPSSTEIQGASSFLSFLFDYGSF